MDIKSKSREEVLAAREARRIAKLAAKCKSKQSKPIIQKDISNVKNEGELPNTEAKKISEEELTANVQGLKLSATDLESHSKEIAKHDESAESIITLLQKENKTDGQSKNNSAELLISKAQLRAERRAKQESQRALKSEQKLENKKIKRTVKSETMAKEKSEKQVLRKQENNLVVKESNIHKAKLFIHLYQPHSIQQSQFNEENISEIHPAIASLGIQYRQKRIIGSNARCIALLDALQQMISIYKTPADKDFSRGFEATLSEAGFYLNMCRPLSVSMINALKHIKWHLTQLTNNISDNDAQNRLIDVIDLYVKEQIDMAGKAICIKAQQKICPEDVILTYGFSSLIERIFVESHRNGKHFRIIIVDSGPLFEGRELLRRLTKQGVHCTYVLLSAASFIMREANKVFLGAHALLTNGYVMSRAGVAHVALIAHSCNVPVLVCCETYKFSERVQTDALVHNELGEPEKVIPKELWQSNQFLTPLSLMYDITPPDLVTAVITELAILPCTSVPVVLRVKPTESTL